MANPDESRALAPARSSAPELVIALVGPVGIRLREVLSELENVLARYDYHTLTVELAPMLEEFDRYRPKLEATNERKDERADAYMRAGDDLRDLMGANILAALAIRKIRDLRAENSKYERRAYVLKSLKHPDEVALLREVYKDALLQISIYQPRDERTHALAAEIARSRGSTTDQHLDTAKRLLERDQRTPAPKAGQDVRKLFPLADVFVSTTELPKQLRRAFDLLFGGPEESPTPAELAMHAAWSAARRSTDLSRQIGAAITVKDLLRATGCNEVPKPRGGHYWTGDRPDRRDFKTGRDSNEVLRRSLIRELVEALHDREDWLAKERQAQSVDELVEAIMGEAGPWTRTRIGDLIEFSSVVHAEMSALGDALRAGVKLEDARMYVTTFPCHLCARLIIDAGITEVTYIEPYPKSRVREIFGSAVKIEDDCAETDAVHFTPFVGIAPRRFLPVFEHRAGKDAGFVKRWITARKQARPRIEAVHDCHLKLEESIIEKLTSRLADQALSERLKNSDEFATLIALREK